MKDGLGERPTTALSTWEESTDVEGNGGEFTITYGGGYSDADDSVSFGTTMDVAFDDSHRTHLVIEDGVETTHDELERHATGSSSTPANGPVGPKRSTG